MKYRSIAVVAPLLALATACATTTQEPTQQSDFEREQAEYNRMPDTRGTGAYPSMMEVDPTLPLHVIYRPQNLPAVGKGKLGVFIWGNGGCADDGASQRLHLSEIASHGYVAIAPGEWLSGPNAVTRSTPEPQGEGMIARTSSDDLMRALDWLLAENTRPGSRFEGMIDPDAIAIGGFSCGGIQALTLAGDPRVDTLVIQNSGIFADGAPRIPGMDLTKEGLSAIHTPIIYIQGGPTDIAYENGMDDYRRITGVPAYMVNLPTGHGGTYNQPNGGKAAQIVVDWLDWRLRGDAEARSALYGADCGWCADPEVTVESRNER